MPARGTTPLRSFRSENLPLILATMCVFACGAESQAAAGPEGRAEASKNTAARPKPSRPRVTELPETTLGVADRGIFSDLDDQVSLALPDVDPAAVSAVVDSRRDLLVLYAGGWPIKAYPLGGDHALAVGDATLALRAGDRAELADLLHVGAVRELGATEAMPPGDDDDDGLPDPLDLLIGAKKTVINADAYVGGYYRIDYPMGDVPREIGVCTDVIIRAVRNIGSDLQAEVQRDIQRAPRAYPMVKRRDPNINHRRVKTLLPYFRRHWELRSVRLDDSADPLRPGDVVFMDTFASKPGPDHIGIISNRPGESGYPLVINNWTDGSRTDELDLLDWVPVTHRFRYTSKR